MTMNHARIVGLGDVAVNTRRGGEVSTLLSPSTVGSTSGFMGAVRLAPSERVSEHYHPYSEEFLYVVRGELACDLDGVEHIISANHALLIPVDARHRLRNVGEEDAFAVFHIGPLAPRPDLGHVDTEVAE